VPAGREEEEEAEEEEAEEEAVEEYASIDPSRKRQHESTAAQNLLQELSANT
jgi:hypothetical protein